MIPVDRKSQLDDEIREALQRQTLQFLLPATSLAGLFLCIAAETLKLPWSILLLGWVLVFAPLGLGFLTSRHRRIGLAMIVVAHAALALAFTLRAGAALGLPALALPTALAALFFGFRWGIACSSVASVAVIWVIARPDETGVLAALLALALIWLTQLALQALSRAMSGPLEWAWSQYEGMRADLELSLDQRVELKETRDDLIKANQQLERLSQRLEAMTVLAEEALQTKEQFLANVSHELRTPLNMIIGFSEMISQSPEVYDRELPSSLLADIAVVQRNSQHLASLVDDILDLSKAEAGRVALEKGRVSFAEMVETAIATVGPLFTSRGLYLRAEVDDDLPLVYCDRTRVRQVILNLLSNAGRFTVEGGVTIRAWQEGGTLLCSVSDTGPGIPASELERIFEPFQQVGSPLRRSGGSGLGLSISRMFVELHGGKMWAESQVGSGSSFCFRLPQAPLQRVGADPLQRWFSPYVDYQPRERPSKAPQPRTPPRLVVQESGRALSNMLSRYGGEVEVATTRNLDEALRELDDSPALALIVNEQMGQWPIERMPGLSNLPYGTPALLCWMPSDEEAMSELGVVQYLTKPVLRQRLLSCLETVGAKGGTILVVDDQPEAVQMLTRMLLSSQQGYQVLRATSARRALTLLRQRRPDLVLLDLYMPGMDGYELLRRKSQDAGIADIPVVAVSAHDPTMPSRRGNCITVVHHDLLTVQHLLAALRMVSEMAGPTQVSLDPALPERLGA